MKQVLKRSISFLLTLALLFGLTAQWSAPLTANAASNPYDYNATDANGNWANCTWWAWQLAYDNTGVALPTWGNARDWYSKAQAAGYSCDTTPSANSIACQVSGTYGHVMFVTAVDGNRIYVKQGGYRGTSNGYHEGWVNTSDVSGYIHLGQNHNPVGAFDIAEGKTGQVFVRGWAFDPDSPNSSIDVHVYIGGPDHSTGEGHAITANYSRPDVNTAYGISGDHGFSHDIVTAKSGTQTIYVFAINTGEGGNICIDSKTVNIKPDTESPVISDVKITDIDKDGYTVTCKVTDNVIVNKVTFPTWTSNNGQDDIIWYNANISGDTASFRVLKSNHNNESGEYRTDIYAQDYAGNYAPVRSMFVDLSTYTLTYNANGGTGAPASQTGSGNITLSTAKPTRSGYTFKGWATSAGATTAQYSAGASYNLTGNATLYAVWQKNATPAQATVKAVSISDFTINYRFSSTIKPQITADEGAKYSVKYESSDPNVANVDNNGRVTGEKRGAAVITCTVTDEYGNEAKDTCAVSVDYTVWQWIIIILLFGWLWYI